jgi:putative hemolysin
VSGYKEALRQLYPLVALVLAAAFFSGTETALLMLGRSARARLEERGRRLDRWLLGLLEQPGVMSGLLLVGSELTHTALAAYGALSVYRSMDRWAMRPALFDAEPRTVVVVASLVLLPVLLIVGEIAPRAFASKRAERWMVLAVYPLALWAVATAPLRWSFAQLGRWLPGWLRGPSASGTGQGERALREDEFRALVDVGSEVGEVRRSERRLIHNVFEFADRSVADIMTPATKVFALSYDLPLARIVEAVTRSRCSRVPIYRRRRDEVVGVLLVKDLVGQPLGRLKGRALAELLHPPLFVPKTLKCDRLFREFQRRKTHLALVVDEYGRLLGLVTMEDLLQELFGGIVDGPGETISEPPPGAELAAPTLEPNDDGETSPGDPAVGAERGGGSSSSGSSRRGGVGA